MLFYNIVWPEAEEMIKRIWKAYFTTPGTATFLTVEGRISMVNILPYSRLESAWLQLERKTRERERERDQHYYEDGSESTFM